MFELPEDIAGLSAEEVNSLIAEGQAAFAEMDTTGASIEDLTAVADAISALSTRAGELNKLAALRDANSATELAVVAEVVVEEAPVEMAVEEAPIEIVAEEAPVAAPVVAAAAHRDASLDVVSTKSDSTFSVSNNKGDEITVEQIGSFISKNGSKATAAPTTMATINYASDKVLTENKAQNMATMRDLRNSGALTAGIGWCAPSETRYDVDGIWDADYCTFQLPTIQASRGGIEVPVPLTYADGAARGFVWNETMDQDADAVKECDEIVCAEYTGCTLEARGYCLTIGNMTDLAFPEWVDHNVDLSITVLQQQLSEDRIARLQSFAVASDVSAHALGGSFAADILSVIEHQVLALREEHRSNASVEVLLPCHTMAMIRADLSRKSGVNLFAVSDAMINEYFSVRGINLNFGKIGDDLDLNGPWPTVTAYVWFSGQVFALDGGELNLGLVRDTTTNSTNSFQLFAEVFYCPGIATGKVVSFEIDPCTAGQSGANDIVCA